MAPSIWTWMHRCPAVSLGHFSGFQQRLPLSAGPSSCHRSKVPKGITNLCLRWKKNHHQALWKRVKGSRVPCQTHRHRLELLSLGQGQGGREGEQAVRGRLWRPVTPCTRRSHGMHERTTYPTQENGPLSRKCTSHALPERPV